MKVNILLLFVFISGASLAQDEIFVDPEAYTLGYGDTLEVIVTGNFSFSYRTTMDRTGNIAVMAPVSGGIASGSFSSSQEIPSSSLAPVGFVNIKGLTINMTRDTIEKILLDYYKDIEVALRLVGILRTYVYIMGEVSSPGTFPFIPGKTVLDYIGEAGGFTYADSRNNIYIIEENGKKHLINEDDKVESEDKIVVETPKVYVMGEVSSPGSFVFTPGKTVMDYIGEAGGFSERAHKNKIYVVKKNGEQYLVNPVDIVESEDKIMVGRVNFKWWEDYVQIASVLTTLVVTWLTITK